MRGLQGKLKRWWMAMTNEEQRDIVIRGATVAVCAVAATVTLPVIGSVQADIRAQADFSEQAQRFAQIEDGGASVRLADHAPSLLDTPWIRTVEYTLERDTASSMSRYAKRDRDGAAIASLVSFKPEHLKRAEALDSEAHCLAQAIYYESRNEPLAGQLAVAEVISNRVRDHRYPDSVCGVVFQGATRTTGCQFTFTCDGALGRKPKGTAWEQAQEIAAHVLMNLAEDRTGGATHYHATYVDPVWSAGLIKTDKIGLHVFYRFPRGSEWAKVRQDYNNKRERAQVIQAAESKTDTQTSVIKTVADKADDTRIANVDAPTVSPAAVTTSTRTITNGAPRLTKVRATADAAPQAASDLPVSEKLPPKDSVAAYTAAQSETAAPATGGMN